MSREYDPAIHCGAKRKRDGMPCTSFKMANGKCRMHFGNVDRKRMKNHLKHGVYSVGLLEGERVIARQLAETLRSIDEEIIMLKVLLRRVYAAQRRWVEEQREAEPGDGAGLPIYQREDNVGTKFDANGNEQRVANRRLVRRQVDFGHEIRRYTKLIVEAVSRKCEIEQLVETEDVRARIARELREFGDAALEDLEGNGNGDADGE